MTLESHGNGIDEHTIELIADRVAATLRAELEAIAAGLADANRSEHPLTVNDVAERFGVARSTVYAHWREWGGYKLGAGDKAAIRFRPAALPEIKPEATEPLPVSAAPARDRKSRRRAPGVLRGTPRLPALDDVSSVDNRPATLSPSRN